MNELKAYRSRGARALVLLHERELRTFLATYRRAQAWGVDAARDRRPRLRDAGAVLRHVLGAAGGYLRWTCAKLGLPDPQIDPAPPAATVDDEADAYLEHVLERWRLALSEAEDRRFEEVHPSNWGTPFSIEAMLEHAVVHPMRHAFQLEELMGADAPVPDPAR